MQCDLTAKKCVPCEGGVSPLEAEEVKELLAKTDGWELSTDGKRISRRFEFPNFVKALDFTNKIGEVAESEGHHPDLTLGWGYVGCTLWTHAIGALHENDFIVASKINALTVQ